MYTAHHIRNFSIIAHIDHGKSTLSDRLIELTGTIEKGKMQSQILDDMDLERERGITIKSHPVRMIYDYPGDNTKYQLNLIDTPGHVDFSYEVSKSLHACEGAILVVDATQGIEAQTLSNIYLALENELPIIPVINKTDLPSAHTESVKTQICDLLGSNPDEILCCSAKTGEGVLDILEAIITRIPPPQGHPDAPLKALVFDSVYDSYRGAIAYIRIFDGSLNVGDAISLYATATDYDVSEIGFFKLRRNPTQRLCVGETGYLVASIREVSDIKIGDTVTLKNNPAPNPLPGYKEIKPMIFSGIYPEEKDDYENVRQSLDKLRLNDASIVYEPESSLALGFGFRAGFSGLLHMQVVQERLAREFNVDIITTTPSVRYEIDPVSGEPYFIDSPSKMPDPKDIHAIREPVSAVQIVIPSEFTGVVMKLCESKRGQMQHMDYLETTRVCLHYRIPLSEMVIDFFDKLKSCTRGYGSMDYELAGYEQQDLIRLDVKINGSLIDAFSAIVHREKSYAYGQYITSRLKELIPRQMTEVAIQAAIGSRVIARTTVKALRKNVTAKCYGGDITRKRKLIEKQKEGKKRMKKVSSVDIPQEAFLAVLKGE